MRLKNGERVFRDREVVVRRRDRRRLSSRLLLVSLSLFARSSSGSRSGKRKRKRNNGHFSLSSAKKNFKKTFNFLTCPSWRDTPPAAIVRVRPQQIAHGAFVRHLLHSVERSNVVERVQSRAQATVEAKDGVVNRRSQWQVIKQVSEMLPDVCVSVLAQALVVKAIHLRDLPGFVVSAEDRDPLPVSNFQRNQQRRGLDRVVASVDVVSHKQVVGVRRGPTDAKELQEILLGV